jgi:hypothetical protein
VLDTPGILDRPLEERNTIEMQSITALAHLRAAVIYIIDLSEQCGYSLAQQVREACVSCKQRRAMHTAAQRSCSAAAAQLLASVSGPSCGVCFMWRSAGCTLSLDQAAVCQQAHHHRGQQDGCAPPGSPEPS